MRENHLTFGSVCSGIEAASVAFHPLGWRAAWLAEIEAFPRAVLAHHYPAVPNLGDMRTIVARVLAGEVPAPDLLCGGTPCQAFSVAGLRESLADERGNLTLEFVRIADAIDRVRRAAGQPPVWVLWENVPGVLSTDDNAFGAFLGGLCGSSAAIDEPADGWPASGVVAGPARVVAWRVLDAQYFGLAQRRRRVFVLALGGAGGWACADALLPITDGLSRDPAPRRQAQEDPAGTLTGGARKRGGFSYDDVPSVAACLTRGTGLRYDSDSDTMLPVAHSLRGEGFDASEDGTGRGTPLVTVVGTICRDTFSGGAGGRPEGAAAGHFVPTIAFDCKSSGQNGFGIGEIAGTQRAMGHANSHTNGGGHQAALIGAAVRRLTPRECERLQGFPDDYTAITVRGKPAADGPRYKALGNSWAVPCARWIGRQIATQMEAHPNA